MTLYAHTAEGSEETREPLAQHLNEVATIASDCAAPFGGGDLVRALVLPYDIGKVSKAFQAYLRTGRTCKKVDHSTAGARVVAERYQRLGKLLTFALAGHRVGLADAMGRRRIDA